MNNRDIEMAKTIGVIQLKGGAGRSTVSTTLAGGFSAQAQVALIDCDMPQGTSASWASLRNDDNLHLHTAEDYRKLIDLIDSLQAQVDYIVIDTPPRIAEITRAVMVLSDLALMPIGTSAAEVWASSDMLPIIEQAKQARSDIDIRIVWTRYRSQTKAAGEISEQAEEELGLKALKSRMGMRVAYPEALGIGATAAEMNDRMAKLEAMDLINEVLSIIED